MPAIDVLAAPDWLHDLVRAADTAPASGATAKFSGPIPEGRRNEALTSLAGILRFRCFGQEAIEAALLEINQIQCNPPLPKREVKRIAKSVCRYPPAGGPPLTDVGNAQRLVDQFGADLRFWPARGKWLIWDGRHWSIDGLGKIVARAKLVALAIDGEAIKTEEEGE
jgi:putative DNA primase/helicase